MPRPRKNTSYQPEDPLWYKEAIIYELHVKAFADGDGDGVGDFKGLAAKMDYLQELGVTALWLLPFSPSPLRDDGYDMADYRGVHPKYGTLADFKRVVKEAHHRRLKVITELVINHTSDQHPWFQRARRAEPGSVWRDFYVWSDNPDKYSGTRIIFQDFETSNWTWDPVAKAYYWHRFYSHQPDLNFDNPRVIREVIKVLDYWLDLGVDGLRLDAVPYLYEREGTSCENLPETHQLLKKLRAHVDEKYTGRMLLAEANQWSEEAAAYFGDGDECHMAFHFPVMPRLFMALRMEDRFPIVDIMEQTPGIPESCQWAIFLRNHDELTLEMVTDEERDFMYRTYAADPQMRINVGIRRRLAPLLTNHRKRIELLYGLLFSLPGAPVLYYGDEIGMGDNIYLGDRDGVRTPMQWSGDRNAGFSRANPQKLYLPVIIDPEYHYQAVNVEAQQNNPSSLLWWTKRIIALRKRFQALGLGRLEFLHPSNNRILAFIREYENHRVLVVFNLSRFAQFAELDLSGHQGRVPVELFGRSEFPPIGDHPYFLTMGPHSFYWFELVDRQGEGGVNVEAETQDFPVLAVDRSWTELFKPKSWHRLEPLLPDYLARQRWFGDKARGIKSVRIQEALPVPGKKPEGFVLLTRVTFSEGDPARYVLSFSLADPRTAEDVGDKNPRARLARVRTKSGEEPGLLVDAVTVDGFLSSLLNFVKRKQSIEASTGRIISQPASFMRRVLAETDNAELKPRPLTAEQSNSSAAFGDRLIMKMFRKVENGPNPDVEIGRYLTKKKFEHVPSVAGTVTYARTKEEPLTLGVVQEFVPNQGDAWSFTLQALSRFFEFILAQSGDGLHPEPPGKNILDLSRQPAPEEAHRLIGAYLDQIRLLGRRTAQLHQTLADADPDDADFAPEVISGLYRRSLYQSMRNLTGQVFRDLSRVRKKMPGDAPEKAKALLDQKDRLMDRFKSLLDLEDMGQRIRVHGDYHLGQVLFTGKDFVMLDFEGEPARSLAERRNKRSPLKDVAGMLRSFHYAAYSALFRQEALGMTNGHSKTGLRIWAEYWTQWVSASFLSAYLDQAGGDPFLPGQSEIAPALDVYLLEKAVYELGYEMNNRPDWIVIPLSGIERLLEF
jgi:maltose alpha-D-glucosyltransferase/alpha-amylase